MDATSLDWPEPVALPTAERLDGMRIGIVEELMGEGVEPGVRAAVERSIGLVEELGAHRRAGQACRPASTAWRRTT